MTEPLDVVALLDEVSAVARTGLHFSDNPFDRERYERLLEAASRGYASVSRLEPDAVRERFAAEIGYVTAKVGADAAVFDDDDRVLLVHRADDRTWGLVAGWIDANESPETTVRRELREEAGLEARVDALVGVFFRPAQQGEHPHGTVSIVYLCSVVAGTPTPQPHEVIEVAYRDVDELAPGEWHHHHETLARAAREAHRRRRAGL